MGCFRYSSSWIWEKFDFVNLPLCHERALEEGKNNSYSCNALSLNNEGTGRRDVTVVI